MRIVIVLFLLLMAVILLVKNDVTNRNMMVITNVIIGMKKLQKITLYLLTMMIWNHI